MSARRRLLPLLFALAGCSEPAGLRIDIDLAGFQDRIATLRVTVTATPGGFSMPTASTQPGVTLSTQVDAATGQKLVMDFAAPFAFGSSMSFRLATGNHTDRQMQVLAVASDASGEIAEAQNTQTLPGGGHATVSLALVAHTGPPPSNTIDLAATPPDVLVKGGQMDAAVAAVALCDVDGDTHQDLVIGAPGATPGLTIGSTGAVYVIFGPFTASTSFNLADTSTIANEMHIFGANGGDRFGASVACADVDKNGADDLVIGAPNATPGGIVYVALGTPGKRTTDINLPRGASRVPADVEWDGPAGATLGSAVFAADLDHDLAAEILVSASGSKKVHLFSGGTNGASWAKGLFTLDGSEPVHLTFAGVAGTALGAGDLDGSGTMPSFPLDVIIGDPSFQSATAIQGEGIVYVFGDVTPVAPGASSSQVIDVGAAQLALVGPAEGSQFGTSVLAVDLTNTGQDLFVGAPGESGGNGAVRKYTHDTDLFRTTTRPSNGKLAGLIPGERFGGALAGSAAGSRLYVGASAANVATRNGAGAVYVFRGDSGGTPQLVEQIVGANSGDRLGAAVAGGLIDGSDAKSDLLAAAPGAMGADVRSGVAYVRFGR